MRQLASTNVSSLIGWDGKLLPNASIELEASSHLPRPAAIWRHLNAARLAEVCAARVVRAKVYVSNASHPLRRFEYTKDNVNSRAPGSRRGGEHPPGQGRRGLQLVVHPPPKGWHAHTWHSIVVPISDAAYPRAR